MTTPRFDGEGFMFVRRGIVQHYQHGGRAGMIVATTHDAAKRLMGKLKKWKPTGPGKITIAAIGSVPGETLDQQYLASMDFGASGIWLTDDGESFHFCTPSLV